MRTLFSFFLLLPLFAAEQNSGKRLGAGDAEAAWAAVNAAGLEDLSLPVADGVIQVVSEPNGGQRRLVRFVATRPMGGKLLFRIVASNGSSIQFDGFELDWRGGGGGNFAPNTELWNGQFPPFWPGGQTRFDVFHLEDGKLTKVSAFVSVFGGPPIGPALGDVAVVQIGARPHVFVPGIVHPRDARVVVGFASAQPLLNSGGQLFVAVPVEKGYFEGDNTLTVCVGGVCTTRVVHIGMQQPVPGPPPPPRP